MFKKIEKRKIAQVENIAGNKFSVMNTVWKCFITNILSNLDYIILEINFAQFHSFICFIYFIILGFKEEDITI